MYPSWRSRSRAARTGVRLTPVNVAISLSMSRLPGARRPRTIRSRSCSYTLTAPSPRAIATAPAGCTGATGTFLTALRGGTWDIGCRLWRCRAEASSTWKSRANEAVVQPYWKHDSHYKFRQLHPSTSPIVDTKVGTWSYLSVLNQPGPRTTRPGFAPVCLPSWISVRRREGIWYSGRWSVIRCALRKERRLRMIGVNCIQNCRRVEIPPSWRLRKMSLDALAVCHTTRAQRRNDRE